MASAAAATLWTQPTPPPRLRIGRKKSHWLLEAAPAAVEDDAAAALRRRLAGLGTSELSLFAVSEFDSEFQRCARLRRRLAAADDQERRRPNSGQQQRPVTCLPKVQFLDLTASEDDDSGRPTSHVGVFSVGAGTASSEDDASSDVASVSDADAALSFPASLTAAERLPIDPVAAARAEARRSASLRTLCAVTGVGDSKRSVADAFCDSAWPHTAADFARPRTVLYAQNLRLHPALAGSIRSGIIAGRRTFDVVSFAGLCELDRRWPSLAKTRHDRIVDWLMTDACG